MVASKTALLLFSSNVKIEQVFKEGFWHRIEIVTTFFRRQKVLNYEETALLAL